ncbi:MAG: helix-turn-helix domain-containing protein [Deferribacterales bacterium]
MNTIAERMKELRKLLDLSQTDFGKKIGKNYHSVMRWELGKVLPPDNVTDHICDTFNVSKQWLVNGTGDVFSAGQAQEAHERPQNTYAAQSFSRIPLFRHIPKLFPDYSPADVAMYISVPCSCADVFAMKAPACSAAPILPDDTVLFTRFTGETCRDGDMCVIRDQYGEVSVRRFSATNNIMTVKKPDYPDIFAPECAIIGLVCDIYRKIFFS